jgi:glycosyltransferase involved in cell wall biosynthesis
MANARPVISTSVGGVIDLLGGAVSQNSETRFVICQRGLSVPANDASAFADGLNCLAANASLRREIGERGLQFVQTHYSQQRLLEDVRALYADLLKGRVVSVKARSPENRLEPGIQ